MTDLSQLKVAIVHEWLVDYSGSERVVEQLLKCFPQAELYAVVDFLEDKDRGFLGGRKAHTSFIQHLPRARKSFRSYLPLMPLAIEQFDMSGFDLIISSSHAVAKGVLTGPDQIHVSYVHSPIRYAWDMQHQYLRESGLVKGFKAKMARAILHYMRLWDTRTANGVDHFVANSAFIGRRIRKAYRRDSEVIYPPVATQKFQLRTDKEDFYLTAQRMVPYKRVPLIVEAFRGMPDKKLIVIGDGTEFEAAKAVAGPNVTFLGYQSFDVLLDHMQRAKAFVFAAEEDFGITPVEAQACGTPVIAYGRGGALETVVGLHDSQGRKPTGLFFAEQTVAAIQNAVNVFEKNQKEFQALHCRQHAESFSEEAFIARITNTVKSILKSASHTPYNSKPVA